jgi:hypothetical protein
MSTRFRRTVQRYVELGVLRFIIENEFVSALQLPNFTYQSELMTN